MTAFGSPVDMNEMIEETLKEQSETEAQVVDLLENETIRGFYANKKLMEFILEAPSSQVKLVLVPANERKSKKDFPPQKTN